MAICPKCGKRNLESAAFCRHCGSSMVTPKVGTLCPNCGVEYPLEARYCDSCGVELVLSEAAVLQKIEDEGRRAAPPKPRGKTRWVTYAIVIVVAVILLAAWSSSTTDNTVQNPALYPNPNLPIIIIAASSINMVFISDLPVDATVKMYTDGVPTLFYCSGLEVWEAVVPADFLLEDCRITRTETSAWDFPVEIGIWCSEYSVTYESPTEYFGGTSLYVYLYTTGPVFTVI